MVVISMTSLNAAEPRPNVLFIAVDDLRTSLGCYGDTLVKSPNIDRFAATARRFDHAYTQQAVCGPSRTSLLTGRLPDNTRVWHNRNLFRDAEPDIVTLPQLFKNHGYHTVSLGKIFSGNERELVFGDNYMCGLATIRIPVRNWCERYWSLFVLVCFAVSTR